MSDAFYLPLSDATFRSTEITGGPWDPRFQHGGPPVALLVHALERCEPVSGAELARVTAEFLGPVPIADLTVSAEVVRGGRRVQLLAATLSAEGRPVLRAQAWRLRRSRLEGLAPVSEPAGPALGGVAVSSPIGVDFGYARGLEWLVAGGVTTSPGPATVWARLRAAIVAGVPPSPMQRVVAAADSGNGISAVLDWNRWSFANVDLTVHLARPPHGEWICVDAATQLAEDGVALATSTLYDTDGRIGAGAQSLLVLPR